MKTWNELTHYAGFDWAGDHHDVVIVDRAGLVVAQFRFNHSAAGWNEFRQKVQGYFWRRRRNAVRRRLSLLPALHRFPVQSLRATASAPQRSRRLLGPVLGDALRWTGRPGGARRKIRSPRRACLP
jgi:hypothetical protein